MLFAFTDGAGTVVANYNYDAWGNVISVTDANGAAITDSTHIANVNRFAIVGIITISRVVCIICVADIMILRLEDL